MKINDKISESRSNKKLCNSDIESNKKNRKIIILVKQNSKEKEHEIMFFPENSCVLNLKFSDRFW